MFPESQHYDICLSYSKRHEVSLILSFLSLKERFGCLFRHRKLGLNFLVHIFVATKIGNAALLRKRLTFRD